MDEKSVSEGLSLIFYGFVGGIVLLMWTWLISFLLLFIVVVELHIKFLAIFIYPTLCFLVIYIMGLVIIVGIGMVFRGLINKTAGAMLGLILFIIWSIRYLPWMIKMIASW